MEAEFVLNDDQIKMLKHIHSKRWYLLIGTFIGFTSIIFQLIISFLPLNTTNENTDFSLPKNFYLILGIIGFIIIYKLFFNKIVPISKDIKKRSGIWVAKKVAGKNYFPYVNTYYIFFDDPMQPNKQVSEAEYNHYQAGDIYYIPTSLHSRLVLDGFMNYELF